MYYNHFGLKEPPFKITPNTEVFFTGSNRGAVLDALIYAVSSGEGIVKVVGEVGSGKTMLCRMLQTMLPKHIESIYLANPSLAPEDILHAIAFELQLKLPKDADKLTVMQKLQSYLLKRHAAGKQVVIFVEEAQGMPLATLEEIRLLSNLETKHEKLLQIVLFGQPELDDNLNQNAIRQLRERITHSFNLVPLQTKEVEEYLMFRLRAAGYHGPPIFAPLAIRRLSSAAQGLVRRVNILADKALLAAFADNVYQVTPKHVQAAIFDSQFGVEKGSAGRAYGQKTWWVLGLVGGLLAGLALAYFYQHSVSKPNKPAAPGVHQAVKKMPEKAAPKPPAPTATTPATSPTPNAATTPTTASVPVAASTNPPPDNLLNRRLNVTKAWLAAQSSTTVTIQILGGSNDAQLQSELEALSSKIEQDNIYVYRTQTNQQPFITVVYGSFPDRFEATRALQKLPEEIQKNKPQLRTVAGVLAETQMHQ